MSTENCTGAIPPFSKFKHMKILNNVADRVNFEPAPSSLTITELHRCNSALEISK